MMRIDCLRSAALGLAIVISALPRESLAQPILQFSAVQLWTGEPDVHTPIGLRVTAGASFITASVEHVRDHQVKDRAFCFGLIGPDSDCSLKPTDIHTRLTTAVLGVGTRPGRIAGRLELGMAWLKADWQSRVSTHRIDETQRYFAAGTTVELRHVLQPERLYLVGGASARALFATGRDKCADCAILYDGDVNTLGLSLGVEFREKHR